MVDNVTSLTNNGLRDWLVQRMTALVIAAYTIFLVCFFCFNSPLTYHAWKALFTNPFMRLASVFTLGSLLLHAWIGIWTVTTDYIKPTWLRLIVQMLVIASLVCAFIWGVDIFWRS